MPVTRVLRYLAPLVVVTAVVAACGDESGSGAGPPQVVEGLGSVEGTPSTVQLPTGQVELRVGEPGPVDASKVFESDQIDEDATYVGISWDFRPGAGLPGTLAGFMLADDVESEVTAQVGGREVTLGPTSSVPGGEAAPTLVYVELSDAELSDLTLGVSFDGVTQSVAADGGSVEAGRASALYELPDKSTSAPCDVTAEPAGATVEASCGVASVQLPYLTSEGWAEEGQTWTIVDVSTRVDSVKVDGETFRVEELVSDDTVGGRPADATILSDDWEGKLLHTQEAYLTEPGPGPELAVNRTLALTEGGEVTLTATVPLG